MTVIDFAQLVQDARTASFQALPPGDYPVDVIEASTFTGGTGKPAIKAKMRVSAGPHAGKTVFNNFNLTLDNPNALAIFVRHMATFGLPPEWIATLPTGQGDAALIPIAQALVGRQAVVTLGIRQWQGEDRNEVTAFKPAGSPITPAAPVPGQPQAGFPAPAGFPGFPGLPGGPQPTAAPVVPSAPAPLPTAPFGGPPQSPAAQPAFAAPAPAATAPSPVVPPPVGPPPPVPPAVAPTPPPAAAPAPPPPTSTPPVTAAPPGWEIRDGQWVQTTAQSVPDGQPAAPAPAPAAPGGPPPLPF